MGAAEEAPEEGATHAVEELPPRVAEVLPPRAAAMKAAKELLPRLAPGARAMAQRNRTQALRMWSVRHVPPACPWAECRLRTSQTRRRTATCVVAAHLLATRIGLPPFPKGRGGRPRGESVATRGPRSSQRAGGRVRGPFTFATASCAGRLQLGTSRKMLILSSVAKSSPGSNHVCGSIMEAHDGATGP